MTTRNYQELGDYTTAGELFVRDDANGEGMGIIWNEGDPNGVRRGRFGQFCIDAAAGVLYQNTDDNTTWVVRSFAGTPEPQAVIAANRVGASGISVAALFQTVIGFDIPAGLMSDGPGGGAALFVNLSWGQTGTNAAAPQFRVMSSLDANPILEFSGFSGATGGAVSGSLEMMVSLFGSGIGSRGQCRVFKSGVATQHSGDATPTALPDLSLAQTITVEMSSGNAANTYDVFSGQGQLVIDKRPWP